MKATKQNYDKFNSESAYHGNNPNYPNRWEESGTIENSLVRVIYEISEEEILNAGEDEGSLPWDFEHVVDIVDA